MQRVGIVDGVADAARREVSHQVRALLRPHRQLVVHADGFRRILRQAEIAHARERFRVASRERAPALVVFLQKCQPARQDRRLERIEPRIGADLGVLVAGHLAVVGDATGALEKIGVVAADGAAVAEAAQILRRIEAPAGERAEGADPPALPRRALRLGRVLDQPQAMP